MKREESSSKYQQHSIFSAGRRTEAQSIQVAEKRLATEFEKLVQDLGKPDDSFNIKHAESNLQGKKELWQQGKISVSEYHEAENYLKKNQALQQKAIEKFKAIVSKLECSGQSLEPQFIKQYIGQLCHIYRLNYPQQVQLHEDLGVAGL